jgi:hypothetical protein
VEEIFAQGHTFAAWKIKKTLANIKRMEERVDLSLEDRPGGLAARPEGRIERGEGVNYLPAEMLGNTLGSHDQRQGK